MKKAIVKIKASLTKNVGIKMIAVIVAALIWLTVVNISDPEKTIVIYNIPITITDESAITDMNMVYNADNNTSVNITISGRRSVVSKLSADDFRATASLKELSKVNSVPVEIVAVQSSIGRKVTIEKQSMQTMEVGVEEIKEQKFPITIEYSGSPYEGYVTDGYSLSKNSITVTAPVSVLDKIDKVVAKCDVDGESANFTRKCSISLYDKHGIPIKSKDIKLSSKKVKVSVTILNKKEVPIIVKTVGNPTTGYHVESVEVSPKTIILVGAKNKLDEIESVVIEDTIDISDKTDDTVEEIDITQYLPDDVSVGEGNSNIVKVNIKINKLVTKKFTISTKNITVEKLNTDYKVTFVTKNIVVEIQGKNSVIKSISADDINTSINLNKYKEGTDTVDVFVSVPDGTQLLNNVSVKIKISKKKQ
jgi:YbbR domain-containing protein